MKNLITGGCGFIGSHLADRLIKEDHKVVIIDNLSTGKNVKKFTGQFSPVSKKEAV